MTLDCDSFDRLLSVATPRGTVSYTYDKVGRRKTMTVPGQAVVNYTYDNADRLTEGDARNQLTSITGSVTASFQYDAFGRRLQKTVNGEPRGFLYDGHDVVQEQVGGAPSANLLLGGVHGPWQPLKNDCNTVTRDAINECGGSWSDIQRQVNERAPMNYPNLRDKAARGGYPIFGP